MAKQENKNTNSPKVGNHLTASASVKFQVYLHKMNKWGNITEIYQDIIGQTDNKFPAALKALHKDFAAKIDKQQQFTAAQKEQILKAYYEKLRSEQRKDLDNKHIYLQALSSTEMPVKDVPKGQAHLAKNIEMMKGFIKEALQNMRKDGSPKYIIDSVMNHQQELDKLSKELKSAPKNTSTLVAKTTKVNVQNKAAVNQKSASKKNFNQKPSIAKKNFSKR